jgi:hypothetical protein
VRTWIFIPSEFLTEWSWRAGYKERQQVMAAKCQAEAVDGWQ